LRTTTPVVVATILGPSMVIGAQSGQRYPLETSDGLHLHSVTAEPAPLRCKKARRVSATEAVRRRMQARPPEERGKARVNAFRTGNGPESRNICSITNRIGPQIEAAVRAALAADHGGFLRRLTRDNARASVHHLRHGSRILEELVLAKRVAAVAANYEPDTGRVECLDGV
jgi:hypothetical protein